MDPFMRSTAIAAVLAGLSNIAAQYIESSQKNTSFSFDSTRFFHFVLFAAMVTPANFFWQRWLEARFPAYPSRLVGAKKEEYVDDFVTGQTVSNDGKVKQPNELGQREKTEKLDLKNTAIKFVIDSTAGTGLNTLMFITGFAMIRGSEKDVIIGDVAEQFWPMLTANLKVWPLVNIISFSLIPLEHRMLFTQAVSVFWGIYLSLIAPGPDKI